MIFLISSLILLGFTLLNLFIVFVNINGDIKNKQLIILYESALKSKKYILETSNTVPITTNDFDRVISTSGKCIGFPCPSYSHVHAQLTLYGN